MELIVDIEENFPELLTVVDGDRDLDMLLESSVDGERLFSFIRLVEADDTWGWVIVCLLCFRDAARRLEVGGRALGGFWT